MERRSVGSVGRSTRTPGDSILLVLLLVLDLFRKQGSRTKDEEEDEDEQTPPM